MIKVFLDANIFFAAAGSRIGGSALILELAKKKKIKVVTVSYAFAEAERNIKSKLGSRSLAVHHRNILEVGPEIQSLDLLTLKGIWGLENILPIKDIPILVGALFAKVEFLITLDKKLKEINLPFKILNPESFLKTFF